MEQPKEIRPVKPQSTGGKPPPGGSDMEARVTRLEVYVERIHADIADIKQDIRDGFKELRTDIRLLLGMVVVGFIGMAGLMSKGFGWL